MNAKAQGTLKATSEAAYNTMFRGIILLESELGYTR
jgi:hypothetical protein